MKQKKRTLCSSNYVYIYVCGEKIKGGLKLVDNEIRFGDYNKTGGHNNRNDEKVI